jgi:hypothetical protein
MERKETLSELVEALRKAVIAAERRRGRDIPRNGPDWPLAPRVH